MTSTEVMIGNQAIALGLVEAGIDLAAAYPGTPSSEILPAMIDFKKRKGSHIHIEWSVNERVAMEVAFGAALAGQKAVCMMKQVGLNVAFPPLIRGREKALKGALVIVSCDDPGPQSSQTEQDSRLIGTLFNLPVFDASSPIDARLLAARALAYSAEHQVPVILRSTHRVSHAREAVSLDPPAPASQVPDEGLKVSKGRRLGIVSSGMSCNVALDVMAELALDEGVSLYKAARVFPLSPEVFAFVRDMEHVLVLEETDEVLEALLAGAGAIFGRRSGAVPRQGELTYDVVRAIVQEVAGGLGLGPRTFSPDRAIEDAVATVPFPRRPPKLCAGCPHRASFYAMKQAFPKAVFPGDIGCYTLGITQGAVDTCVDMGGSVGLAAGFSDAFGQDGSTMPILASLGDSTFFHAALPLLYDAARKGKKFILVIMDNGTTAMTGMQPTPQSGQRAEGASEYAIPIEQVVKGLGVGFVRTLDPYDIPGMIRSVKEAGADLREQGRGPAVIVARHPCLLFARTGKNADAPFTDLSATCDGCKKCVKFFDCPAFFFDESEGRVKQDKALCVNCALCQFVCPRKGKGKGRPAKSKQRRPL